MWRYQQPCSDAIVMVGLVTISSLLPVIIHKSLLRLRTEALTEKSGDYFIIRCEEIHRCALAPKVRATYTPLSFDILYSNEYVCLPTIYRLMSHSPASGR